MQGRVQKGDAEIRNCEEARAISYGSGSHEGCAYRRQFAAKLRRAIRRANEGSGSYEQRSHPRHKSASSATAGGPREDARAPRGRGYSRGQTYGKVWRKRRNITDPRGRRMIGWLPGPRSCRDFVSWLDQPARVRCLRMCQFRLSFLRMKWTRH